MVIADLSLPIPSIRNHLFLLHVIFNKARKMFVIGGLPLTNPSTRNHFFLLHGALNRVRIIFLPPGKISYSKAPSTDPRILLVITPSAYSIHQESSPTPLWRLQQGQDYVWYYWLFLPPWIITFFTRAL